MNLIPGSKFTYKRREETPSMLGTASWSKQNNLPNNQELTEGVTYIVSAVNPIRNSDKEISGIVYTFRSGNNIITKQYKSVTEAETQLGLSSVPTVR